MSGHERKPQGKRSRKHLSGGSNLRERWRHLSADTNDVIEGSTPRLRKKSEVKRHPRPLRHGGKEAHVESRVGPLPSSAMVAGYDIDGDGQVDIREMRLARFLDAIVRKRTSAASDQSEAELSESDLHEMRQHAGRLLIANEFIERNHRQLWRYGALFASKNDEQSAEFIAGHRKFQSLMESLESIERKRGMRSSCQVRQAMTRETDVMEDTPACHRQTWVEGISRVHAPSPDSSLPLPGLKPRKKQPPPIPIPKGNNDDDQVFINAFGAIDVDGDGVVDSDEMKLHVRLEEGKSLHHHGDQHHHLKEQQLAGRRLMAQDFVTHNKSRMWLYDPRYRELSADEVIEDIASHPQFAREFNKLRAKERVLTLKSSTGVSDCITQIASPEHMHDVTSSIEFRPVKHRTELVMARRELQKPPQQRLAALLGKEAVASGTSPFGAVQEVTQSGMQRSRSDCVLVGLPKIYDTPHRIEPIKSFSVTKWLHN